MHNRSTHIADLNLLLTIFIVILHSLYNPNKTIYHSGTYLSLYNILVTLFDSAVPTFFVISSFLFFRNLSKSQIIAKIKKRFKSLIIPYLIFSIFFACLFILLETKIGHKQYIISNLPWDIYKATYDPPIWYLRTLFYFFIISPIIFFIFQKTNKYICIGIIFFTLILNYIYQFPYDSFIFWLPSLLVGTFFGFHYPYVHDKIKLKNIYLSMCILVFILLIYIVSHYAQNSNIYYLYRIISSFFIIPISFSMVNFNKIRLHEYTFFIYMIHYVVIRIISYPLPTEVTLIPILLRPFTVVILCFIIAYITKKILPYPIWGILNGNR